MTPQQLVNSVKQMISQNIQSTTNSATPYHLRAASIQTPSNVVSRNSIDVTLSRRLSNYATSLTPLDGTDPTNATEDLLSTAIYSRTSTNLFTFLRSMDFKTNYHDTNSTKKALHNNDTLNYHSKTKRIASFLTRIPKHI